MAMYDSRSPAPYQFPSNLHRKAVPAPQYPQTKPVSHIIPGAVTDVEYVAMKQQHQHQQQQVPAGSQYMRRNVPGAPSSPTHHNAAFSRRTPSTSTSSTAYTGQAPSRTPSAASSALSRTSSSRSQASCSPTSYVALMRKQKATVWCDRGQHEDPRIVAQQKAAKIRAARDISGPNMPGRTSTGSMGSSSLGMRSKIKHNMTKTVGQSYANTIGSSVPVRLSANEVGDEAYTRSDSLNMKDGPHKRSESGRLSQASNQWLSVNDKNIPHRNSNGSKYSGGSSAGSGNETSPAEDYTTIAEMPTTANRDTHGDDYFGQNGGEGGSGGSAEREASFGNLGNMDAPRPTRREEGKTAEELRRRGSVDERANTLSGNVRLFIANPD